MPTEQEKYVSSDVILSDEAWDVWSKPISIMRPNQEEPLRDSAEFVGLGAQSCATLQP